MKSTVPCNISQKVSLLYEVEERHGSTFTVEKDVTGLDFKGIVDVFNSIGSSRSTFRLRFHEVATITLDDIGAVEYRSGNRCAETADIFVESDSDGRFSKGRSGLVVNQRGAILHEPEDSPRGWFLADDDKIAEKNPVFADFVNSIKWPSGIKGKAPKTPSPANL